jgi:hypothetical protein
MAYQGKERETVRISDAYRIVCYDLNKRSIFLCHSAYAWLMSREGGRLPLAGKPLEAELAFDLDITAVPVWKGRDVKHLDNLLDLPIKGLAPGIVHVTSLTCPFLFYGNVWIQVACGRIDENGDMYMHEPTGESQTQFMDSIENMERQHAAIKTGNRAVLSLKREQPTIIKDDNGFPTGEWMKTATTGDRTKAASLMEKQTGWKFQICYKIASEYMLKNNILIVS